MRISEGVLRLSPDFSISEIFRDGDLHILGGSRPRINEQAPGDPSLAFFLGINLMAPEYGYLEKTRESWRAEVKLNGEASYFRIYQSLERARYLKDTPRVWLQGTIGVYGYDDLRLNTTYLSEGIIIDIDQFSIQRYFLEREPCNHTAANDNRMWREKLMNQEALEERLGFNI